MDSYRVTVTYCVDVADPVALLAAGASIWADPDDRTAQGVTPTGKARAQPGPEASIAFAVGRAGYPTVPGVRFTAMSINVEDSSDG